MITAATATNTETASLSLSHMSSFYGMLAQLSFVQEVPEYNPHRPHAEHDARSQIETSNNMESSGIMAILNGCFCFSMEEDLYFDAVQDEYDDAPFQFSSVKKEINRTTPRKSSSKIQAVRKVPRGGCGYQDPSRSSSTSTSSSSTPPPSDYYQNPAEYYQHDDCQRDESIEIQKSQHHAGINIVDTSTSTGQTEPCSSSSSSCIEQQTPKKDDADPFEPLPPPLPPKELPLRFLRAGKGDPVEGRNRYEASLKWRRENGMDTILTEAFPNFELIKQHYPHYYHLSGHNGEPVFFEQPPKTNLQAMRKGGIGLDELLRHYAMVTEFQWQFIERDDFARSITVLDLEGMRMMDFVGECVEYVKKASAFTGQHYPERAGYVLVVNVPGWFQMIWKVVRPMVDESTLEKISILRGKDEVLKALKEKIPVENIPPEYGGTSMPLGQSPQEILMRDLMRHNNALKAGDRSCGGRHAGCRFCSFVPARSY